MYEVSPDYGMIVQAWNIYAVAVPVVNYFFGIQPEAHKKQVTIAPDMPEGWDNVSISNVLVGDNNISFTKTTQSKTVTYKVMQRNPEWKVLLSLPIGEAETLILNGKETAIQSMRGVQFIELTGLGNVITIQP